MWFENLTGFCEKSFENVHKNLSVEGKVLKSSVNGKSFFYGELETPNLENLRNRLYNSKIPKGKLSVCELIGDVQELHKNKLNEGALFQVASQFNLLEMPSPNVTPAQGVDGYEYDRTQGPACAIAAGAGTIYRNYFAETNGKIGQSVDNQIDCLYDIGVALGNANNKLWEMQNGYALASKKGLIDISNRLNLASESDLDSLRNLLRIGIQWDTEVTITDSRYLVSQAYCSALPVAYSKHSSELWSSFAKLILEASYEATICTGVLNYLRTGNKRIYLTLLGGGAFGNNIEWITSAIYRSLNLYRNIDLDVRIVSNGSSNKDVQKLVNQFSIDS
jgi:hypothetical protein